MKYILLILIISLSLASTACSYITDFVVVNASESPIEVSYKIKGIPNHQHPISGTPSITVASQLKSNERSKWQDISTDRFEIDQPNRTVKVKLMPQEALLITRMHHYTGPDDPSDVEFFPIEELSVAGSIGSLKSSGKQLLKAFNEQS
ncbi:MAG TPA: hypothetical protein VEF04_10035, partial [Blastocatellia bacterium]|nr:hypothetical protein [Blastocatellia bacterium]